MSAPLKLLAFAAALAATFVAAYGVGAALDPVDDDPPPAHAPADPEDHVMEPSGTEGHP